MAAEEIYTAYAIAGVSATAVMMYLHHKSGSEFWKVVWTIGMMFSVMASLGIVAQGLYDRTGVPDTAQIVYILQNLFMWGGILFTGYMIFLLLMMVFNTLKKAASGEADFDENEVYKSKG